MCGYRWMPHRPGGHWTTFGVSFLLWHWWSSWVYWEVQLICLRHCLKQQAGLKLPPSKDGFSALEFILKTEVALNSQLSPCLCLSPIPNTGVKGVLDPPAPAPWFLLRLQVCTTSGTTLDLEVWIPAIYTDVTEQTRTSRAWVPQGWKGDFPGLFCPLYIKGISWPH